uniref:Putative secreted protein n=1 Tax=Anopheles darlingi TaxID=43151 RepID=A0A2M4DB80_ANODA
MKGVVVTFAILFMPFILCSYVCSSENRSQVGYSVFCVRWNIRNHEKAPLPPSVVFLSREFLAAVRIQQPSRPAC